MSCSVGANSVRPLTAKVITVSDRSFRGEREDLSGPAVKNLLERAGYAVGAVEVLPDEQPRIASALIHAADEEKLALIVTTGGTGLCTARCNAGGDHQGLRKAHAGYPGGHAGSVYADYAEGVSVARGSGHSRHEPDHQSAGQSKGRVRKSAGRARTH